MPPLNSNMHRDRALENISIAYKPQGLIADELSPKVMVSRESDIYYVYSRDTMAIPQTRRAMGSKSNRATYSMSTSTYVLEEEALHDLVPDRLKDNVDKPISLDIDTTEILTQKVLLRREKDLATVVQTDTNWSNNASLTSTLAWSANTTTSNPITLIDSLSSVIVQQSGMDPNTLVLTDPQFRAAKEHTSIVDRIKHTSPDSVTPQMLARLFNLERILVAKGVEHTAKEGLADTTTAAAFIWTDAAFLCYVTPTPKLKTPSALYTFWKKEDGSPYRVKRWRSEEEDGDTIEVRALFQNKAVATLCAALIEDIVQ